MAPRKSSSRAASSTGRKSSTTKAVEQEAARLTASLSTDRAEPFKSLDPRVNEIVPPPALANLANYHYSTVDESILQKYAGLHTYWGFCVSKVPHWVAPNMLTLLALFFSMSYPLLIISYEYRGVAIPDWVWLYSGFALFAYQTLDSIDGKHARRTGAKSALGELFDHGCDALFTPFCIYAAARALAMSNSQIFIFTLVSHFGLFLTMLEHFLCGSLTLGMVNGPTEGVIISVGLYIATFVLGGPAYWSTKLAAPFTVSMPKTFVQACRGYVAPSYVVAETNSDVAFAVLFALAAATVLGLVRQTYILAAKRTDAIIAYAVNVCALCVWALFALLHRESAYASAGKFSIIYGSYFAFTASHLTVHRLCQLKAGNPYGVMALSLVLPLLKLIFRERICVGSYAAPVAALITLMYVHYLVSAWHQFARVLNVNVVTLTEKQLVESKKNADERRKKGEQ